MQNKKLFTKALIKAFETITQHIMLI